MRLAAVHDRLIQRHRKVAQQGLLGRVVGDLVHHIFVLADLVANRVGIVDQVLVGQPIGYEQIVQTADDLREPFPFLVPRLAGAEI